MVKTWRLIETPVKARRRPYRKQKLALVLANPRHFALAQARRGVVARYIGSDAPYGEALPGLHDELGTLQCMLPAELKTRRDLDGAVQMVPHAGWLSDAADFVTLGKPP